MRKILGKLFATFVNKERNRNMANPRYFPNSMPDYPEFERVGIDIPVAYSQEKLNEFIGQITDKFKPTERNAADGVYLGAAGVAYMFYHLSKISSLKESHHSLLSQSVDYLKPSLSVAARDSKKVKDIPSFILGNCGIYAVAAAVYKAIGDKSNSDHYKLLYHNGAKICKDPNFLSCGGDELFVGRAGYILGALWMSKELGSELNKKDIYDLCKVIVDSGRKYATRHHSGCPLMYAYYNVEYLGAAHGLCSILQVLLSVPGYLNENPLEAHDVKASVDYLLSLQDKEGNFPCSTDEIGGPNELVHWCHGAPGMIYLMAKAYLTWKDEKYIKSCILMGDLIWEKGLLLKGPGICHGVGGNGYAFLLLYRITDNLKYLHRAIAFAQFMDKDLFKRKARIPDNPYSLYEGIAGTACFMGDLMEPKQAMFPFFDVIN